MRASSDVKNFFTIIYLLKTVNHPTAFAVEIFIKRKVLLQHLSEFFQRLSGFFIRHLTDG